MQIELLRRTDPGSLHALDPRLGLRLDSAADRRPAAPEYRDRVGRIDLHVRKHLVPAREMVMLPLVPKNSRPAPARRPALASRME